MSPFDPLRRRCLGALAAVGVAGCGGIGLQGGHPGPPLAAPDYRVGDRWVYHCSDGFRDPVTWTETHLITAMAPANIEIGVTIVGPTMNYRRVEHLLAPGIVASGAAYDPVETRLFTPPLVRYQFPLAPGRSWRQNLHNPDANTQLVSTVLSTVTVGGYTSVGVPAGTFDALTLRVFMSVDDNDPFRWPTQVNDQLWWSAQAGAMVRQTKEATYLERTGGPDSAQIRAQHTTIELTDYRYGERR